MKEYRVYRGVDNQIEFKGLKGKYFYYGIGAILGVILFCFITYLLGVPAIIVIILLLAGMAAAYFMAHHYNQKYGRWGADKMPVTIMQPRHVIRKNTFRAMVGTVKNGKIISKKD